MAWCRISLIIVGAIWSASSDAQVRAGFNIANAERIKPAELAQIFRNVKQAGATDIRLNLKPDEAAVRSLQLATGTRLGVLLIINPSLGLPGNGAGRDRNGRPKLSAVDTDLFGKRFVEFLTAIDDKGIRLSGIEVGNEINLRSFNGDLDAFPPGTILSREQLEDQSPRAGAVRLGLRNYIKMIQIIAEARDRSVHNKLTPVVLAGLSTFEGNASDFPAKAEPMINSPDMIDALVALGADRFVDVYGVHVYPYSDNQDKAIASRHRTRRLDAYALSRCASATKKAGKPCWITEWGYATKTSQCADDGDRARVSGLFHHEVVSTGKNVPRIYYFAWNSDPWRSDVDPFSVHRCGRLLPSGKAAVTRIAM